MLLPHRYSPAAVLYESSPLASLDLPFEAYQYLPRLGVIADEL